MKRLHKNIFIAAVIVLTLMTVNINSVVMAAGITDDTGSSNAVGEETTDSQTAQVLPTVGYTDIQEIVIDESDIVESDEIIKDEDVIDEGSAKYSAVYNSSWDKYATNYFYNQLSDEQKELWDRIDALAISYIDGDREDEDLGTVEDTYVLGRIVCTTDGKRDGTKIFSSDTERQNFFRMFRCSAPQYYYINTSQYIISSDGVTVYMPVYEAFAKAADRETATAQVSSIMDSWVNEIGTASSKSEQLDKAYSAHKKIINSMTYNNDVTKDGVITPEEEQKYYTQSAYSALVLGTTVCAGYSAAYQMLCNALGIDAVSITSTTHEWNEVRLNDSWYNVDCTWDDSTSSCRYFTKSDRDFQIDTSDNVTSHTYLDMWIDIKPVCTLTSVSTTARVGTLLPAEGTVAAPEITVTEDGDSYLISISDETSDSTIYYTTDGTTPSPAYTKCDIYKIKFTVSDYSKVKAVAVKDKYLDSDVVTAKEGGSDDSDDPDDPDDSGDDTISVSMYRLYNPNSGEHFYTASYFERNNLIVEGWSYEGVAWYAPESGNAVYRMYNPNAGDHHYTLDAAEKEMLENAGWDYEGIAWYSGGSVVMLRAYNPNAESGAHHYTASQAEIDNLVALGWKSEGKAWYGVK